MSDLSFLGCISHVLMMKALKTKLQDLTISMVVYTKHFNIKLGKKHKLSFINSGPPDMSGCKVLGPMRRL
jgi:hypothetical protein